MGHRFEWWQPKSLVKRWKHKNLGYIIKNAQYFDGHESQKTHVVLHAAAHHGASQPRMTGKIVSDNDELQIRKLLLLLKLALQRRKRFDDAHHILMWPNRARIKNKRIVHQIALGNQFAIGVGGMAVQKALVNRVVHHLDAIIRDGQQLFDFVLSKLRHRDHARRLPQHAPRQIKVQAAAQTGSVARSIHVLQEIVHGQNIRATQPARDPEQVRNVNHVALQPPHDRPESEISLQRVVAPGQLHRVEVRRQRSTFRRLRQRSDEEVFTIAVQARQRADHVPDVGAHPEFRHATDVDGYFHSLNLTTGSTGEHREFTEIGSNQW